MSAARGPVRILLPTYNGARFLPAQLDSLLAQTFAEWELYVRDDGSTDSSVAIVRGYAARDARIKVVPSGDRLGAAKSFARLLQHSGRGAYVFFCDQDDVWRADKMQRELDILRAHEQSVGATTPLLVHTDARLIDPDDGLIAESFKRHAQLNATHPALPRLLAQNFVTGCTCLANAALVDAALPVPAEALMHDWWFALVAAARGEIIELDEATMDYRQHGANASGGAGESGSLARAKRFWRRRDAAAELMRGRLAQATALSRRLSGALDARSQNSKLVVDSILASLREGGWAGVMQSWRSGVRAQGFLRNALYYWLLWRADAEPLPPPKP